MQQTPAQTRRSSLTSETILAEAVSASRRATERRRGRQLADADAREALARLMRQSDAEIGGTEQLRLAYRAQLELQWSRL
jgi:hypothetical protein